MMVLLKCFFYLLDVVAAGFHGTVLSLLTLLMTEGRLPVLLNYLLTEIGF